jgi:hypothetical protein
MCIHSEKKKAGVARVPCGRWYSGSAGGALVTYPNQVLYGFFLIQFLYRCRLDVVSLISCTTIYIRYFS